ncbi:MAG: hypothetical protein EBR26_05050, partial [Microbacteriaceae bacterium]|nr:hypothetical protein [Microbacteriaceae bacterium]
MIQVDSLAQVPNDMKPTVVTIGKFDGIHLGHQQLIAETISIAENQMLTPALITFDRHPSEVLQAGEVPSALIGPNTKSQLLDEAGIELMLSAHFDQDFANLSARDFVKNYLV